MTTATTTSPEEIRERLIEAERELTDAERSVGAAVLDGGDPQAARDRVEQATAAVDGLKAALAEWDARAGERQVAEQKHREDMARWRFLSWYADYVERLPEVLRLREELEAAEARVMVLREAKSVTGLGRAYHRWFTAESEAGRIPPMGKLPPGAVIEQMHVNGTSIPVKRADDGNLTPAECAQYAKQLAPLLKAAAKELGAEAKPENLPWEVK